MYRKFFGLAEDPFNLTPDSRFLYLSSKHREALANLLFGIQERKGFITLTGEIGSGKTTLCRTLTNELDPETTRLALILNSYLNEVELLQTINEDFGIPAESSSKKDLIKELNRFLLEENLAGHNVVLIIDEAQNLSIQVLEQIRMLSNLETETEKLIQIVLMGQPELLDLLSRPELEQLNQRISVRYHINPLDREDVSYYIRHRLFVARAQIDIEFTAQALKLIYDFTGGIPRKINVLCDRCLLAAYSKVSYTIDAGIAKEAIAEIEGENRRLKKAQPRAIQAGETVKPSRLILLFFIIAAVIGGGIYIGMRFARQEYPENPSGLIEADQTPGLPSYLESENTRISGDAATSKSLASASPTPVKKKSKSRPRTVHLYNWQYDGNGVCRVNHPAYSHPACIITWLRLWNIEVELDDFRDLSPETIQSLDLTRNETLGLKKMYLPGDLEQAIGFDLPLILVLNDPPENMAPEVVLIRAEGMSFTIGDPLRGRKTIHRGKIQDRVSSCLLLYFDRHGLGSIVRGEQSERVKTMQESLHKGGYYKDAINGIFGVGTRNAVRRFQRYYELEATGNLDQETVILLSTRMITMRPRLFSSGGED